MNGQALSELTKLRLLQGLPALLCLLVLMVDIATPLPLAAGIGYIPIIFCSLWFRRPYTAFIFAAVTSLLTLVGAYFSPPGTSALWVAISNRVLTIGALWSVAFLVHLNLRGKGALQQKDAALSESEERYALAVRGLSIGIWDWNIETGSLVLSPRFRDILGVADDDANMLYDDFAARLNAEDQGRIKLALQAHIRGDGPYEVEYRTHRTNGQEVWIKSMGQAIWDSRGEAKRMVGSIEDISERKFAETARGRLAAVVESSGDAIITKTLDGVITSWNAAAESLFGYDEQEAVGRHIDMLLPQDRLAEEVHIMTELCNGRRVDHYDTVRLSRSGRMIDISLTISPILDAEGNVVGASKIARDISDRREIEKTLLQYTSDLERSNQDLDEFAYIASHDLKEPLRGLFNNARFLNEDYSDKLDKDGVKRLERLGYLTQRMERLIDDLLYFSRLGRQALAFQSTDLNQVVDDVAALMETSLAEQNARIVVPRPLPTLICDKTRVTEVYRNLIGNAVKYNNRADRTVEVGFAARSPPGSEDPQQVFFVKDNGIGIEPEFHDDIFRLFKRLNEEDDARKGTGVGLTFVRKIIERHGGRIWLESTPHEGSTFYFTLTQGACDVRSH